MRNHIAVVLLVSSCFGLQPAFSQAETSNASGAPVPGGVNAAPAPSATAHPATAGDYANGWQPTKPKSKFSELLDDVKDIARDFVNVEKGPDGVHVKAPFVRVDTAPDGVHVKAPLVDVNKPNNGEGAHVKAPFVDVTKPTQSGAPAHVKAPLVDVTTDQTGKTKVDAPFVHVNEGASTNQPNTKKP